MIPRLQDYFPEEDYPHFPSKEELEDVLAVNLNMEKCFLTEELLGEMKFAWGRRGYRSAASAAAVKAFQWNPNKFDELYVLKLIRSDSQLSDHRFEIRDIAKSLYNKLT